MTTAAPEHRWPLLRGLSGYRRAFLGADALAGLALAAVAAPEQMATASLAGVPTQAGLIAFIAATGAIAVFGASRFLSVGADSTIAPVFAGALAMTAAAGSGAYLAQAAALALIVGMLVTAAGALRLGWLADLISTPVTIGFLAGVAVHILMSQLPGALGLAGVSGSPAERVVEIARGAAQTNGPTLAVAAGVLALTAASHRLGPKYPGALAAVALATAATAWLHLRSRGVAVVGTATVAALEPGLPHVAAVAWLRLIPLALLIGLIVMVQTAATSRAFPDAPDAPIDLDRDLIGVGLGSLAAGFAGAFPVNASPPRTAIVADSGAKSQAAGLFALAAVAALAFGGASLLAAIPKAALSGVLIFIALRIVRLREFAAIARSSPIEAWLLVATAAAVVLLPIAVGVGCGVGLSLLHGVWSSARPRTFTMARLPGTTVWWPRSAGEGETVPRVAVVGFQAPLDFLNAEVFRRQMTAALNRPEDSPRLLVLEAAGVIDIDYTAAQAFKAVIGLVRDAGATLAVARLESMAAQRAFYRFGLDQALGAGRLFPSVEEAITALADANPEA